MAIDKNKTKNLIKSIDELFETLTGSLPAEAKSFLKDKVMGPAFDEIRNLVDDSRPPVLLLMGRSGHGKSSVINALANKKVAEVSDIKPGTPVAYPYFITFEDRYSCWQVIDTRGIFETTRPDGAISDDATAVLEQAINKYKPDAILHVISSPEIRNLSNDLNVFKDISNRYKKNNGYSIPTIITLNKADTLGNPRDWPPEQSARKAGLIKEALDYLTSDVFGLSSSNIDLNNPLKGYKLEDDTYIGVIPVCAIEGDYWNIETLSYFIGEYLPEAAILNFFQAQKRKDMLKKISTSIINRFSVIAGGIGASPIPFSDIAILIPLQMLMIAIIGGLSCREFTKETIGEYLATLGINIAAGYGIRMAAQQILKFVPFGGWAVSGTIASTGTRLIGKSAEAYFFYGEVKKPDEFKDD